MNEKNNKIDLTLFAPPVIDKEKDLAGRVVSWDDLIPSTMRAATVRVKGKDGQVHKKQRIGVITPLGNVDVDYWVQMVDAAILEKYGSCSIVDEAIEAVKAGPNTAMDVEFLARKLILQGQFKEKPVADVRP